MLFDIHVEHICNIVVLTKMEHSLTVKPEHVYNVL